MSEQSPLRDHPGYAPVMAWLPKMYLAACSHPQFGPTLSPFKAALSALVFLHENLQTWESEYLKLYPDAEPSVIAARDFDFACELLIACYPRLDPAEPKANANYIGGLVDVYRTGVERAPSGSVSYAKSSPRY